MSQLDLLVAGQPDLSGVDETSRRAWAAFLAHPEAADLLIVACECATAAPAVGESRYLNGDDLIRAMRKFGTVDNRIRSCLTRYVVAQHPSCGDRFRFKKKGKAA